MDARESVAEGRRLWGMVGRNNLMIKIPATEPGLEAIHDLIADGINVNVTLLFSQKVYERVVEAYLAGLEKLNFKNGDLSKVSSVASFFISRIDASIEKLLDAQVAADAKSMQREFLEALKGKVAIANAKLAYQRYIRLFSSARWKHLADNGARPQRLLWASTGTKNKTYSDVLYLDELIGPNTVNTVPPATLNAFRDHGKPSHSLQRNVPQAEETIQDLSKSGISLDAVADQLVAEGVKLFSDAADILLGAPV
jgi:transaldolase/glucose-6-phosphate isomerase